MGNAQNIARATGNYSMERKCDKDLRNHMT